MLASVSQSASYVLSRKYISIVVDSRDHKGVGVAHKITSPKNQPKMVRMLWHQKWTSRVQQELLYACNQRLNTQYTSNGVWAVQQNLIAIPQKTKGCDSDHLTYRQTDQHKYIQHTCPTCSKCHYLFKTATIPDHNNMIPTAETNNVQTAIHHMRS